MIIVWMAVMKVKCVVKPIPTMSIVWRHIMPWKPLALMGLPVMWPVMVLMEAWSDLRIMIQTVRKDVSIKHCPLNVNQLGVIYGNAWVIPDDPRMITCRVFPVSINPNHRSMTIWRVWNMMVSFVWPSILVIRYAPWQSVAIIMLRLPNVSPIKRCCPMANAVRCLAVSLRHNNNRRRQQLRVPWTSHWDCWGWSLPPSWDGSSCLHNK